MSAKQSKPDYSSKPGLHPRNVHKGRYNFPELVKRFPELAAHTAPNKYGDLSIDFSRPESVKALNRALLFQHYGIEWWDIPPGYLCPPIPGRADYLHYVADLLAEDHGGKVPEGSGVRGLDIGTGANAIYPLLGNSIYGWSFVVSDVNKVALDSVRRIAERNPGLGDAFRWRRQDHAQQIFQGVIREGERFDFTMCNPPFHASPEEAVAGSRRKWKNLKGKSEGKPVRNFGGQNVELWCPGGEKAFVKKMIQESQAFREQVGWFTTLVSKKSNLPALYSVLDAVGAGEVMTVEMAQGQKTSRILAWKW